MTLNIEYFGMRWFMVRKRKKRPSAMYLKHRKYARAVITARVKYFAGQYDFAYGRIAIKNQKRCWGSCSTKGNLNFNYKLVFLPSEIIDYIVVHELCHLRHFHHRAEFWAEVAVILPDYKTSLNALREIEKMPHPALFNKQLQGVHNSM
jgi:predicted metal-dependent hydrolase